MAKNTKTVRKRFDYRQCDDFAAYLNHMARQGWHFKEFRSKLVFEKGEPENSVYAVEIFTDGTEHDMQPSYKAMSFAEYCEAAGWKLIDQRVKWCVLKRIREDAVPIFTDEERFENVKSVSYSIGGKFLLFELLFIALVLWRTLFYPKSYLFSLTSISSTVFLFIMCLGGICQTVTYRRWCKRCREQLDRGEPLHFRQKPKTVIRFISGILFIPFYLYYTAHIFGTKPIVIFIYFAISMVLSSLPRMFRMSVDSSKLMSTLFIGFHLFFYIVLMGISTYHDMQKPIPEPPVPPSVFQAAETVVTVDLDRDTSPFGSKLSCNIYTLEQDVGYYVYKSQYDWVLDAVWNQEARKADQQTENCADDWDALDAFRTAKGRYVIRYEDRILILKPGPEPLKQDQIDIIVAALKEG